MLWKHSFQCQNEERIKILVCWSLFDSAQICYCFGGSKRSRSLWGDMNHWLTWKGICDVSDQLVENLVRGWPQVKVLGHCLDDLGVSLGSALLSPFFTQLLTIFWYKKLSNSISSRIIVHGSPSWAVTMLLQTKERENPDHMIPLWGEGCRLKPAKFVILCYFPSIFWLIIVKIFRILKIVCCCKHPLPGGGVWCNTPAVKSSQNHCSPDGKIGMRSINTEVPAFGDSLSWDTNLCVCDITTRVHANSGKTELSSPSYRSKNNCSEEYFSKESKSVPSLHLDPLLTPGTRFFSSRDISSVNWNGQTPVPGAQFCFGAPVYNIAHFNQNPTTVQAKKSANSDGEKIQNNPGNSR